MSDGHGSGLRARVTAWCRRRPRADERGFTLVEMLIGIVILGTISTTLMGTLMTTSMISSQQRTIALVQAEARRISEKIIALGYVDCATPQHLGTDYSPDPPGPPVPISAAGSYSEAYDYTLPENADLDPALRGKFSITQIAWDGSKTVPAAGAAWPHYFRSADHQDPTANVDDPTYDNCHHPTDGRNTWDCGLQQIMLHVQTDDGFTADYTVLKASPVMKYYTNCSDAS